MTAARDVKPVGLVKPLGLSDWIGIFAIITFVGFAETVYEVATPVFDD